MILRDPYSYVELHFVYHIFMINSSVVRHLGCYQMLVIILSAEINNGVHMSI